MNSQNHIKENENNNLPDEELYMYYYGIRTSDRTFPLMPGLIWKPLRRFGFGGVLIAVGITQLLCALFNLPDISASLAYGLFSALFLGVGCYLLKTRKQRLHKKFIKYNNKQVKYSKNNEWECPCCKTYNTEIKPCEVCGVYPKIIK